MPSDGRLPEPLYRASEAASAADIVGAAPVAPLRLDPKGDPIARVQAVLLAALRPGTVGP